MCRPRNTLKNLISNEIDSQQKHFYSQKYLFSQNVACLVTNAALTGHAWKDVQKTANVKSIYFHKILLVW